MENYLAGFSNSIISICFYFHEVLWLLIMSSHLMSSICLYFFGQLGHVYAKAVAGCFIISSSLDANSPTRSLLTTSHGGFTLCQCIIFISLPSPRVDQGRNAPWGWEVLSWESL